MPSETMIMIVNANTYPTSSSAKAEAERAALQGHKFAISATAIEGQLVRNYWRITVKVEVVKR